MKQTQAAKEPTFDSLQQEVYLNLWRTYDQLKAIEEELFVAHDLSPQQYNALRLLRSAHPESMPTLALGSKLISRAPDMTRLLDRLEKRDLITRERKPENRRVVEIQITPAGLELLERLEQPVRECHDRQLGHLSERQLRSLLSLLKAARGKPPNEDS